MKFLKSSAILLGAIALMASPAMAQYGREEEAAAKEAEQSGSTIGGIVSFFKAYITGGVATKNLFDAEPDGLIANITDANYKSTIFEDEWVVAL